MKEQTNGLQKVDIGKLKAQPQEEPAAGTPNGEETICINSTEE